jgi:hypothetical protein
MAGVEFSAAEVAVAFDDELPGRGVGVKNSRQQWDPHDARHAHGELLPGVSVGR